MDFLGLTNKFLIETGLADAVASLEDAADDVVQAAHWIDSSWASFQRHRQWPFRRAESSLNVINGKTEYTFEEIGLAGGDIIRSGTFYNPNGSILQVNYPVIRLSRRSSTGTEDTSKVRGVSVVSGKIHTHPDVATTQTVEFDYLRGVQELVQNGDVPYGLPSDFHMLIVHGAVARYGVSIGGDEGIMLYNRHARDFTTIKDEYLLFAGIDGEEDMPKTRNTLL
jgi:hypothetical protein